MRSEIDDLREHSDRFRAVALAHLDRFASVLAVASNIALGSLALTHAAVYAQRASGAVVPAKRMLDGKQWTTGNLAVDVRPSYCYADSDLNCRRYGRLYTWEAAKEGCHSLDSGWRLPSDDDWRRLARHYGGVIGDSIDAGRAAYKILSLGGRSGFGGVLGGNRSESGQYERLDAHGFYWTITASDAGHAWFYNFGRDGLALNRQRAGDKRMAISVRCIRD